MINTSNGIDDIPKITIITVVFNGKEFIEGTIRSVLEQDYPAIEYIVIDGGSQDGTVDIIRSYENSIDYWRSESDCGIYDAMNKGILKASGQWVNFMNAGDRFFSNHTVSDIFSASHSGKDIIFGGVEIRYPDLVRYQSPGKPEKLWQGMQFSHQSAFINRHYHQSHLYNIRNRIAADLQFFYNAFSEGVSFHRVDMAIASVVTGGVSEKNRINTILASQKAVISASGFYPIIRLYYVYRLSSTFIRSFAKKILPQRIVKSLILLKK